MAIPQTTPTQEVTAQPNEAGFSTNLFLSHTKMGRVQFTFRGATSSDWGIVLEDVDRFLRYMHDKGWQFDNEKPAPVATTPAPQEPTRQPIDDSGNELPDVKTATAGRLSWEVHDGKSSYKVMDAVFAPGERGTKYGITVWPEVLKAAGLNVEMGQPVPNISGWRVDYVLNEKGYPQKVTRLLPPK